MDKIIEKEKIVIEDMIYEVRGVQVMLSSDVAKLYQVETKRLNEVIKRNINRFPESFCFQLTNEEIDKLSSRSQFATLNKNNNLRGYNIKYLPYVLTEQGVMMLSGLLKSDIAVKVNIEIIDAFVKMRKYFVNNISNTEELDLNNKFKEQTVILCQDGEYKKYKSSLYEVMDIYDNDDFIVYSVEEEEYKDIQKLIKKGKVVSGMDYNPILVNDGDTQTINIVAEEVEGVENYNIIFYTIETRQDIVDSYKIHDDDINKIKILRKK